MPPGCEGLLTVPYWNAVQSPHWDPFAKGVMFGWGSAHTRAHAYRSILEGMALELRENLERVQASTGRQLTELRCTGGGSRSKLWRQIIADATGLPMVVSGVNEVSAQGAAVMAMAAIGAYPDVQSAAEGMSSFVERTEPDMQAHALYGEWAQIQREIYPAVADLFTRTQVVLNRQKGKVIMAKIAVLGSGIMATALSFPASENGNEVHLIGTFLDREIIDSIQKTGLHPDLGLKVNDGVVAHQLEEAAEVIKDADVVMCGVNSFGVEWVGEQLAKFVQPGQKLLVITKGMRADEDGTLHLLPNIVKSYFDPELAESVSWNAITGPSIAGELAVHHHTAVVFCGHDQDDLDFLANLFRTDYYHVWTSLDFNGYETGAATKNVYAFAAGFAKGLLRKQGKENDRYVMHNYSAAIFAQGQRELTSFIKLMGGDPDTAIGLGGVGDMYVTSAGGRNMAGAYVGEASLLRGAR